MNALETVTAQPSNLPVVTPGLSEAARQLVANTLSRNTRRVYLQQLKTLEGYLGEGPLDDNNLSEALVARIRDLERRNNGRKSWGSVLDITLAAVRWTHRMHNRPVGISTKTVVKALREAAQPRL